MVVVENVVADCLEGVVSHSCCVVDVLIQPIASILLPCSVLIVVSNPSLYVTRRLSDSCGNLVLFLFCKFFSSIYLFF